MFRGREKRMSHIEFENWVKKRTPEVAKNILEYEDDDDRRIHTGDYYNDERAKQVSCIECKGYVKYWQKNICNKCFQKRYPKVQFIPLYQKPRHCSYWENNRSQTYQLSQEIIHYGHVTFDGVVFSSDELDSSRFYNLCRVKLVHDENLDGHLTNKDKTNIVIHKNFRSHKWNSSGEWDYETGREKTGFIQNAYGYPFVTIDCDYDHDCYHWVFHGVVLIQKRKKVWKVKQKKKI